MTRETKIGLLVGLAFIIVIGILLSDHLTTSNEPPPAQLAQAGANIRGGIAIPGAQAVPTAVVVPPTNVTPQATIPTPGDLAPKPPVQQIAIGPAAQQPQPTSADTVTQEAITPNGNVSPLVKAAARQGEQVVPVSAVGQTPARAMTAATAVRTYQAAPGDTLSGIAGKLPGGNTKANREAIIAINPDLKANPNLIIAGRTYNLPSTATASRSASQTNNHSSAQATATPQRWYTVKSGDNLWKIANEQTGSPATLDAIRRLNKETLNGKDVVRVGMKLRLPARNEVATTD